MIRITKKDAKALSSAINASIVYKNMFESALEKGDLDAVYRNKALYNEFATVVNEMLGMETLFLLGGTQKA